MEFPSIIEDIHLYLERYLDPEAYTLLNKFCRDVYFRKNGLSIRSIDKFDCENLMRRYRIKILYIDTDIWPMINKIKKYSGIVTEINTSSGITNIYDYICLREAFPNLQKYRCRISSNNVEHIFADEKIAIIERLLKILPLKGTIIELESTYNAIMLKTLADMEYTFEIPANFNYEHLAPNVIENIRGICFEFDKKNIKLADFPNLEYIRILREDTYGDIIEDIRNHSTLKKIVFTDTFDPVIVTKIEGTPIKITLKDKTFNDYCEILYTQQKYDRLKRICDTIVLHYNDSFSKFIKLERRTKYPKKMTLELDIHTGPEYNKVLELLELFDVSMSLSASDLKFYISEFRNFRIKVLPPDQVLYIFWINDSKLVLKTKLSEPED